MKFLVAGLGSMGKRRIRCLKALGHEDVTGFDLREDRREEAARLYGIKTAGNIGGLDLSDFDALIVSVPPDGHLEYMRAAVERGRPAFVEASVLLDGLEELNREALSRGVLIAPSCTLRFHPAIKDIKAIIQGGRYGAFTNFSYHSGQYLPDWHPWEQVGDYYVSRRETGGAREIVPFELTWIVDILGYPLEVTGFLGNTMDVGADIDDSYAIALRFSRGFGTLLVDVVSRYAVRSLILNMEQGQIVWRWDEPQVKVYEAAQQQWTAHAHRESAAQEGYNRNIIETMYIEELGSFIDAVTGKGRYPHTLADDIEVLRLLYQVEKSPFPR